MNYSIDWDGPGEVDEAIECLCDNPDYDLLEGRAHCHSCGRSWYLSSADLHSLLALDAECQEHYDYENRVEHSWSPRFWIIRQMRRVRHSFTKMPCCGQRFRHSKDCDGIPF